VSELDVLVTQQKRDDSTYQDPQRLGGVRTVSHDKFVASGRDFGPDADGLMVLDRGGPVSEGTLAPRGVWKPNRVHPLHRVRTVQDRDRLWRACEDILTDLPTDKEQTVREVVYGQRSQRGAAAFFGISQPAVFKRLRTAYAMMRVALEARSGSAGMDFPGARPFDEADRCSTKCPGHFEPASCDEADCVTILPRHYNPHTSCRIHTNVTTRAEYNLDFLLGRPHAAVLHDRSAVAPVSEAVAS
jgi:hypothetical protein